MKGESKTEGLTTMKTQKLIMPLICVGALAGMGQVKASAQEDDEIRFRQGEFDLSPFGAYVDKAGGKWGGGLAGTYFLHENVGVGASTYWTDITGTFIDNLEAEGYFRIPVLKVVAPYAVGGIGYQFEGQYWFETIGAGVDFRPFKNLTAFSDIQYRVANNSSRNGAFIRLGARISF
jgi:hypothetical protein